MNVPIDLSPISGIILSGGEGRRVGNQDKGWILWQDRPLIEHVSHNIRTQTHELIISCNRNVERYRLLADHLCIDATSGYQGPLAGLQAALPLATNPLCFICPCDTPNLPKDIVSRLYHAKEDNHADVVYVDDGTHHHYLIALLDRALIPCLKQYFDAGGRSVKGWYATLMAQTVKITDHPLAFANINTL